MKNLVNFVLSNKLAVWLLTIIITMSGVYSATQMKTETIPDISIPYLMVMNVYPGATPEKIMNEVSIPMEKAAEGLDSVKTIYSNSYANMAVLQVEYDYGVDMLEAKRELDAALESVSLPEGAQEPVITALSMNMMPVVSLSVSSETEDIAALTNTVENILLPKIEQLEGVGSVSTAGQHIEEIALTYDTQKMAELGVTQEAVKQMVQASDMAVSLGLFAFEKGEQAISVDGKIMTLNELKDLLIPVTPTEESPVPFVKLRDIASVKLVGKVESVSRTNGEEAISIQVIKEQRANTVDVVNAVKSFLQEETKASKGLLMDITLDQGAPIEASIHTMVEKALFGGLIAVLIILLFLRDIKSTIISIISIPVSIFLALLVLKGMDITLNMMTLGAITVAIGRVIDDSIVVVENIYRRMHLKDEPLKGRALVREATIEMFKPILSSTLVTVAVFAPLVFVGGMVGEIFMPFALTMTFALLASLLVAITIVPALSHFLFKNKLYGEKKESKHAEVGKLATRYKGVLEWTLNHKAITSFLSIVLLVGSLALMPFIGFSFLGSEEEKVMNLTYTPATGEKLEDTLDNLEEVEKELLARTDVDVVQLSMAADGDLMSTMMGMGSGGGTIYLTFDPEMEDFPAVREEIETYLSSVQQSGEWTSQSMSSMMGATNQVSYTFHSTELAPLHEAVSQVEKTFLTIEGLEDVTSIAEDPYVEHTFHVEQDKLLQHGLTTAQLVMFLNPNGQKDVLTTIEKEGATIEVVIQQPTSAAPASISALLDNVVPTPLGDVALTELVTSKQGELWNVLARSKGSYYASVSATIVGQDVSKATAKVEDAIEALTLPKGVTLDVAGVTADMNEAFTQLGLAMIAAIAIVYFILVVTFREGVAPFAILFSLPFAIIGSFVGLLLAGETISVSVMMGLLMLIGIVVTNAIVLVDRIIHMERDGLSMREAILEAGATRLRPILMTAIATIGALLPLALGSGGGGLISKGLGITVIGGLVSSTILTLIVVPIVYELLSKWMRKNRQETEEE